MKKLFVLTLVLAMGTMAMAQQVDYSKMSRMLGNMVKERYAEIESTHRAASSIDPMVTALVKADTEEVFARYGAKVIDSLDDLYFVVMTVSQMEQLSMDSHVVRMEANEPDEPNMDRTSGIIGATKVNAGTGLPQAYTGKGVLVGIADSHFDYTHPMFRNADGTTRIKWAWDMYTGRGATEGYRGIGSLYDTPEKLMAGKGSIDSLDYHGAHVASTAAGSPILNGKYRGVAYEADLVMFEAALCNATIDPTGSSNRTLADNVRDDFKSAAGAAAKEEYKVVTTYEPSIAKFMGMKRFFEYAKEHNQPAVMNCSFSAQMSLFNDRALEEEFYNKLTGPGRIIVASAGNKGDEDIYRQKAANATLEDSLYTRRTSADLEFRSKGGDFKITLILNNAAHTEISFTPADFDNNANSNMKVTKVRSRHGYYYYFGFNYGYRKTLSGGEEAWSLNLKIPDYRDVSFLNGDWAMAIKVEGSAEMRMIGERGRLFFKGQDDMINASYTIGSVGSYKEVIGVGMTCHRPNFINIAGKETSYSSTKNPEGYICSWSSAGPRFDGHLKPDVCAPGFNIIAAQDSYLTGREYNSSRRLTTEQWQENGHTYELVGLSGTSMSTPVVAGVVALWLQADPTLTPDRIKEVIAATAKHPDPKLTYPNNIYGRGEIDAYAGLLKILETTSVIPTLDTKQADITLRGRTLHIQGANVANVTVYSLTGQVMMQTTTTDGTVQLPQLPSAVYAVQVNAEGRSLGSTLIRL